MLGRVGPYLLCAVAVALLPSFAEGEAVAYVAFIVSVPCAFVPAAFIARRTSVSGGLSSTAGIGLSAVVGGVLVVSSVDVPALQTTVLGLLVGIILAAAIFVRSRPSDPY